MSETAPFRVWFFTDFEETAKPTCAYTTPEAAQHAAVIDYEAGDTGPGIPAAVYEWRTSDEQPDHRSLFEDGVFTGYWVQPLDVVGDRFETEWTIAAHWRHSVEYCEPMTEERVRARIREEHEPGVQLSIARRMAGQWRHEDSEAQRHADAINAATKVAAR